MIHHPNKNSNITQLQDIYNIMNRLYVFKTVDNAHDTTKLQ